MKIYKSNKVITEFLDNILFEQISKISGVNSVRSIKGNWDNDNEIVCDIFLVVNFGVKIPDVSWNIQKFVKEILSKVDDIKIKAINIHVIGTKIKEVKND